MSEAVSSTPDNPSVVNANVPSEQSVFLKRKLTSSVWNDFDKVVDGNGLVSAICTHCKKRFNGNSKLGTSHLRNHSNRCLAKLNKLKGQMEIQTSLKEAEINLTTIQNFKFDQDRSRLDLCRMVMKHHYSFNIVEHELFNVFVKNLNPRFRMHSRNTLRADVMKVYESEKTVMYKLLDDLTSRVSLTTDLWTCSSQNNAYCALTVHFIDDAWVLRKKILCFPKVESKHDGQSLFALIKSKLLEWNLEKKLFSLTVDNASSNDVMTRSLATWLSDLNLLPMHGELFHCRCAAHILNLIVQDGLKSIDGLLRKIRESVIYVNASPQRKQQFVHVLNQLKLSKMKQPGDDVPTRWNSTFLMLESALSIKSAYARLEQLDPRYTLNPSAEEWAIGESVCLCLKIFYEATLKLSGVKYPTACVYFGIVCGIHMSILKWGDHEDEFITEMSLSMKVKFDKYWSQSSLLMCLGVILDPRFKFLFVEYYMQEIYGIGAEYQLSNIKTSLQNLFDEYSLHTAPSSSSATTSASASNSDSAHCNDVIISTDVDCMLNFNNWVNATRNVNVASQPSELVRYLEDPLVEVADFNILSWWKDNYLRYPTLGRIARDVLAVPVSTVASESSFSIGGNMIDPSRNHLGSDVVEALMCGKDWIELPGAGKVSRRSTPSSGAPLHP